ncbi:MAG: hypothetical protein U0M21_10430, partial [Emergencia sp.]|nr:hypothetical protein [Emergencia sp.]
INIPAFPMAVRYHNCKAKCNIYESGKRCKTKIHFALFKMEINFSLQWKIKVSEFYKKTLDFCLVLYYYKCKKRKIHNLRNRELMYGI